MLCDFVYTGIYVAEEVRELSHLMVKIIWRPYYQKRVEGKRSKKREPLQPKKERLKKVSWLVGGGWGVPVQCVARVH